MLFKPTKDPISCGNTTCGTPGCVSRRNLGSCRCRSPCKMEVKRSSTGALGRRSRGRGVLVSVRTPCCVGLYTGRRSGLSGDVKRLVTTTHTKR